MVPEYPPIREEAESLELDQKRGKWPFTRFQWAKTDKGVRKLLIHIDGNESGQVIGEGRGLAVIVLSVKKAEVLRDWLVKTV